MIVFGSREVGAGGGGGYAGGRTASCVVRVRIVGVRCWCDGRALARRPVSIREDIELCIAELLLLDCEIVDLAVVETLAGLKSLAGRD